MDTEKIGSPHWTISATTSSAQRDAGPVLTIHGRERRIGHDHLVAEGLEVLRDSLALGGGLQQHPHRAHGRKAFARRGDASVERCTALRDDPDLTVLLVEIDGTILYGWSSPLRLKSAFFSRVERKLPPH